MKAMIGASRGCWLFLFFFNDTATTEIYTLSLHDALPIFGDLREEAAARGAEAGAAWQLLADRKSTRLNSSHGSISYAVFCLNKTRDHPVTVTAHATAQRLLGEREAWLQC